MRAVALVLGFLLPAAAASAATPLPTLHEVMAEPDWIGPAVERPRWSADGSAVWYELKRSGSPVRDLYRLDAASGTTAPADEAAEGGMTPVRDRAGTRAAFLRHGDVFVQRLDGSAPRQLTRAATAARGLQWSADGSAVQFRRGMDWFAIELADGRHAALPRVLAGEDPDAAEPGALERTQLRLFDTLREARAERDARRTRALELERLDPGRVGRDFHLGKDVRVIATALSPSGRHLLAVTEAAGFDAGKEPSVRHYVSDSGYGEDETTRVYVGRNASAPQALWLLDLEHHGQHRLDLGVLPGIQDDPLAELRAARIKALEAAGHADEAKALAAPETRALRLAEEGEAAIRWNDAGTAVLVQLRAVDNKDRWLARVDLEAHRLVPEHRLSDAAWINWSFNDFGFFPGSEAFWYLSEESGYSHLYSKAPGKRARQLTRGDFEVDQPRIAPDGAWFYLRTNRVAPWSHDVYRLPAAGGELERLTAWEGVDDYALAPDGSRLAVRHSSAYVPPQLALVGADGSGARTLTDTRTETYRAIEWLEPEFVRVPSRHGAGAIAAKLYRDPAWSGSGPRPAVFFVHGAGYTQDVHRGWSYYFREQMFHNLLARRGYVVLDMDYRASAGYGRAWRTAIYREMGHPELEDLLDGKAWLVAEHGVDPARVGIYGGSYGGFMTLVGLLRAPGEFAAGAALRPVTDWRAYNHEYTSNILNTPQLDPEAYRRSSPIEDADALADPVLLIHGLIDDNVLPDDSLRLYQRFIELGKTGFDMSLYPVERHGFRHASSWQDAYRRIDALFRAELEGGPSAN